MLKLQEGELYVEKKMEVRTLEEVQREQEEKVRKRIRSAIELYINNHRIAYKDYCECLFWHRGIYNMNVVRKFKEWDLAKDIKWIIDHGW